MIVKDEAHIIHESLNATLPLIDTYCIVDTGSSDDTIQKIRDFYSDKGISGEVHERPWKNFGHNRSEALKLCDGKMDYILVIDADDLMGFPSNGKEILTSLLEKESPNGVQIIIKQQTIEYWRTQIFKANDDWKYVGVLHEYPSNGKPNCKQTKLPKEFWMESRRLGGRSRDANKMERDISVLTKGLEDEPENERYMFYLAQSYKDNGNFEQALKYYKKRFKVGKWAEEAWYSAYRVGECYKMLKNIPKFEYWMQTAHAFRPWRAEPIYQLTEFFRANGQLHKAYHYAQIGRKIGYPKDDVLFVEKFPHEGGFDYECSILDYYIHTDKKIGLRDSINYLLKKGEHIQNVVANMKFYMTSVASSVTPLNISNPFGEDFRPSAVSVIDYPLANVRFVNYLPPTNGKYETKDGSPIITKNAYVNLETGESILMCDPEFPLDSKVRGLEDIRVHGDSFTAVSYYQYIASKVSIVYGKYDLETKSLTNCVAIQSPYGNTCEKNWLNILGTSDFIYSWSPFRVGRIVEDRLIIFKEIDTPPLFSLFRGSAPPINWNNEWLCLVHFVEYSTPRKYYHCFVKISKDYRNISISLPFYFTQNVIEYCISIRKNNNSIDCFVSVNDGNPQKVTITYDKLEWVEVKKAESVVRVPSNLGVYWAGKYSECYPNGHIERFLKTIPTTFAISQSDGFFGDKEYSDMLSTTTETRIVVSNEKQYKQLESLNTSIVCALATRGFSNKKLLYLPLDDSTFEYGLDHVFKNISLPSWNERKSIAFWRGNLGGYERPSIREKITMKLYCNKHTDVKFAFFGYNGEYSEKIDKNYKADRCDISEFVKFKYLFIIDGTCIASNHQWVFGSGSVPIMITHPGNNWWFKKYLVPMKHYVPIQYDLSDLEEKIQWLVENDDKAQEIAENAKLFAKEWFTPEAQRKYILSEIDNILTS